MIKERKKVCQEWREDPSLVEINLVPKNILPGVPSSKTVK